MNSFLIYVFQVSVCQTAFYLLYYVMLRKHSFFQANRAYLLCSTFVSFVIPLLSLEVWSGQTINSFSPFAFPILIESQGVILPHQTNEASGILHFRHLAINILFFVYLAGAIIQLTKLVIGIKRVFAFLNGSNLSVKLQNVIRIDKGPAFFSFWKYIFVNEQKLSLKEEELQHVLMHEQVHIQQRHTLDILFMEMAVVICWFNPFIYKMKQALCQTHEYIADYKVVMGNISIDHYSKLILQLCIDNAAVPLAHQFSKINIKNRITMLHQSNTNKMKALKIFFVMPLLALLLMVFSFTEKVSVIPESDPTSLQQEEFVIGSISWVGNTKYSNEYLNKFIDVKPGSVYEKEKVRNLLIYNPDKTTISDLYMDNGYLFYNVNVEEEMVGEKVNLLFNVYEGQTVSIDKIIIRGNQKVDTKQIIDMVVIKKGDLFNRSKLIASQKKIAESGYFKPDAVGINPIPHDEDLMDIEFVLEEL